MYDANRCRSDAALKNRSHRESTESPSRRPRSASSSAATIGRTRIVAPSRSATSTLAGATLAGA